MNDKTKKYIGMLEDQVKDLQRKVIQLEEEIENIKYKDIKKDPRKGTNK